VNLEFQGARRALGAPLRPSALAGAAALAAIAAGAGVAVAALPPIQALVLLVVLIVPVVLSAASLGGWSAREQFIAFVLLVSAVVDIPRNVSFGPASALAVFSLLYVVAGVFLLLVLPQRSPSAAWALRPMWLFLLWGGLLTVWSRPEITGLQNLMVLTGFAVITSVVAAARVPLDVLARRVGALLTGGSLLATLVYVATAVAVEFGTDVILSARSYALFALFGLAWNLAGWRTGSPRGLLVSVILSIGILTSLSRLALGAAVIMFVVAWTRIDSFFALARTAALVAISGLLVISAVQNVESLNERFFEGDVVAVGGGIAINVAGRANFWGVTWDSFEESPVVGHGPGTAGDVVFDRFSGTASHPHNDYLRLLHDYGIVGMFLFAWAFVRCLRLVRRRLKHAQGVRNNVARIHLAAMLALIATLLSMVTDNSVAYVYVMAPLAVLMGLSCAAGDVASRPAPTST
jgi:O-antigen ligase